MQLRTKATFWKPVKVASGLIHVQRGCTTKRIVMADRGEADHLVKLLNSYERKIARLTNELSEITNRS